MAAARNARIIDGIVVPVVLAGQQGLSAARPVVCSPRARAALAVPLVAVLLRAGAGYVSSAEETRPVRAQWPYAGLIQRQAARFRLEPALVAAVISQESGFDPRARNPSTGARGLMQLTPDTARSLGVTDPDSPRQSVAAGCRYLQQLLDRFNGNLVLALAAYNAGPTVVERVGRIPRFPETRRYVAAVANRFARFRLRAEA